MASGSIIKVRDTLIATLPQDMSDDDALELQASLNDAIERSGVGSLLIDVSQLEMIDSFLGRLLNEITTGARLLGARTVVAGIQPAVAVTLVELGLTLRGVRTALSADKGLETLNGARRNGKTEK